MPGEKADEANADEERCDLDVMAALVVEAVDQEADADHLAMFERMREPEEGRCRHAPGDEVIARRNIDAERTAARQQHHQHKNRNEEKPGEIAGEKVDSIEKHADHTVSFPSHACCPQAIEVPIPGSRLFPEKSLSIPAVGQSRLLKSVPRRRQGFGIALDRQEGVPCVARRHTKDGGGTMPRRSAVTSPNRFQRSAQLAWRHSCGGFTAATTKHLRRYCRRVPSQEARNACPRLRGRELTGKRSCRRWRGRAGWR